MQRASDKIWQCVEPVVTGLGYEFVGAEFGQGDGGSTLRVYIDREGGILLEHCAEVSHQLSAVLDVEEPITTKYILEVSSPGVDRPLFRRADFEKYTGKRIKIRSFAMVLGRRNFTGTLESVIDDEVNVEVDGEVFAIPLSGIEQAKVLPEF